MDASKRKRTVLSVDQKLQICKRLKKGASITSLSKELGLGKSTICDISKMKINWSHLSKNSIALKLRKRKKR